MKAHRKFTDMTEENGMAQANSAESAQGSVAGNLAHGASLVEFIGKNVVGAGVRVETAFGERIVTFADYTASGRALQSVEEYIHNEVLPVYANTHTTASATGTQTTLFRAEARGIVRRCVGGDSKMDTVIFTGTGCTGAVSHMLHLLTYSPEWQKAIDSTEPNNAPLVVVGPYEHHSNLLPWRESGARVVFVREASGGGVDMKHLREILLENADCDVKVRSQLFFLRTHPADYLMSSFGTIHFSRIEIVVPALPWCEVSASP